MENRNFNPGEAMEQENQYALSMENPQEAQAEDCAPVSEEQLRRVRRRQRIVVLAAIVCMLAILATGTLAYFTAEETAYNVITTAKLEMKLVEEKKDGTPFEDVSGVMPGQTVDKIVYVKNSGTTPFYARIKLETAVRADGKTLDFDKYISLNLNTEEWIEQDGYYYYCKAIQPGENSGKLFTEVKFAKNMSNAYQSAQVEISVDAQAVQSQNNGNDPLNAAGWNE